MHFADWACHVQQHSGEDIRSDETGIIPSNLLSQNWFFFFNSIQFDVICLPYVVNGDLATFKLISQPRTFIECIHVRLIFIIHLFLKLAD